MKTQFFLARHGETEWNTEKRLQGQLDSPLTERGKQQAFELAHALKDKAIECIVSSPLGRARHTSQTCAQLLDLDLSFCEDLKERHFGEWQTHRFDELKTQPFFDDIFFRVTHQKPPGGESGYDLIQRMQQSLISIAPKYINKNVLIISHGDLIRCFLSQLRDVQFCDAYSQYGNGQYFVVAYCHKSQSFQLNDNV